MSVSRDRNSPNTLALTLAAGFVLLFVVGIIFSVSRSTSQIITEADALHDADEALRAVTVVRAQLEIANLHILVAQDPNPAEEAALAAGLADAEEALTFAGVGVAEVVASGAAPDSLQFAYDQFEIVAADALADIRDGRPARLDTIRSHFQSTITVLTDIRDRLAESVASSDQLLSNIATLAGFLVAFAIPAAILLLYRELSKRQDRQRELQVHLDAEREINAGRESFIATASHELRSPLTGIRGIAHLLGEEPAVRESDAAMEMVSLMIGEAEDLTRLVEDLLTASRIEAGAIHYSFEDIDVIAETDTLLSALEVANISIDADLEPGVIRADRLRLRQMVRNLISNAHKYGGPKIWMTGRVSGQTYVLSVLDDGDGVPEAVAPRLFERFVHRGRETAGRQSVGLGLSIVMALAVGMGGNVFYEREGAITRFTIVLPLGEEQVVQPRRASRTRIAS